MTSVRRASSAGTWYPDDPNELAALVDRCLASATRTEVSGEIVALIVPHAGLIYSGRIAAAGYRLLDGADFDGVLLLGPCHRGGGELTVIPDGAIETPLGTVPIDEELASALCESNPGVRASEEPHLREHSLEVQLPFVQRMLPNVPVTLMLMGAQTPRAIASATRTISDVVASSTRKVLLVASSDLSHYETRLVAAELDARVVSCVERFDASGLEQLVSVNPNHACGRGAMVSILMAARILGASVADVLAYGDSGDVNGDVEGVVGYMSAALCRDASL